MIYNSIEEELWRIFTFYALHSDPTLPEILRPPNFVKFCKDCQIISKKFTPSAVELEMARQARMKSQGVDHSVSNAINFLDFMQLLEMLSVKIYVRDPPEIAAKRLILENVLLLANRRTPTMDHFDINNPEALKLITETFNSGLQSIFDHYTAKAHQRRSNAVSAEKMKHKEILRQHGLLETDKEAAAQVISPLRRQNLAYLKSLLVTQRDTISYKEYLTFTQDFCLKSTALLTATQLGDIYLTVVPLQNTAAVQQSDAHRHNEGVGEGLMVAGMSFALFCQAILYMALLAYRNLDPAVPTTYKVKALLVYMLKCAVDGNRTLQLLTKERSHTLSASKGALCLFGSTDFATQFQAHWAREGYCDYTQPPQAATLSGTHMLRKVVGEAHDALEGAAQAGGAHGHGHSHTPSRGRTASNMSTDSAGPGNAGKVTPQRKRATSTAPGGGGGWGISAGSGGANSRMPYAVPGVPEHHPVRPEYPVTISGSDLRLLLERRPELTELLALEIAAMKLETERLTGTE